jgi:hypothetical protein
MDIYNNKMVMIYVVSVLCLIFLITIIINFFKSSPTTTAPTTTAPTTTAPTTTAPTTTAPVDPKITEEMFRQKLVKQLPKDSVIYRVKNCSDTGKCTKEFTVLEPALNLPSVDKCNKPYQVLNNGRGYDYETGTNICKTNARDVHPTNQISSWQHTKDTLKAEADNQREKNQFVSTGTHKTAGHTVYTWNGIENCENGSIIPSENGHHILKCPEIINKDYSWCPKGYMRSDGTCFEKNYKCSNDKLYDTTSHYDSDPHYECTYYMK